MTELNRAMTSTLLSVQSRSDQTDREQGNGQLKPNQVRVSESSSVTETDYSVLVYVQSTCSSVPWQQAKKSFRLVKPQLSCTTTRA